MVFQKKKEHTTETIWKYPLEYSRIQSISLPKDFEILCLKTQNGTPCLWILVNPDSPKMDVEIITYNTGEPIEDHHNKEFHITIYIGTYLFADDTIVSHVFLQAPTF